MTAAATPVHLAVALDGAGWRPAAWREPRARPAELFSGRYWTDVIAEAERGLIARAADTGYVTPRDAAHAARSTAEIWADGGCRATLWRLGPDTER